VKIEPLPGGEHAVAIPLDLAREACEACDYHVPLHCFDGPEMFPALPNRLEEPLPEIETPLLADDPDVTIDPQGVFDRCYGAGPYFREIEYGTDPPISPLSAERQSWLVRILHKPEGR